MPHSPLWPLVVAAPQAWFGISGYAWAHVANVVASAGVVATGAILGWRIRPAVGALTAALIIASDIIFELSRRVGLDLPAAALVLSYLIVGWEAVRRERAAWGIAAGILLGIAFLVKEIALPFAPVPILAGLATGYPIRSTLRTGAYVLGLFVVVTSWWWVLYAQQTGSVYRLGTPAWTLGPLGGAALTAVLVGFNGDRLSALLERFTGSELLPSSLSERRVAQRAIGWAATVLWAVALAVFFSRVRDLRGYGLLDPVQLADYLRRFGIELAPFLGFGGSGAALAILGRRRDGTLRNDSLDLLWLATIAAFPLILLVVGIGDLPRHFVAQLAIFAAIGATGWTWLLGRVETRGQRQLAVALATLFAVVLGMLWTSALLPAQPRFGGRGLALIAALVAFGGLALLVATRPKVRMRIARLVGDRSPVTTFVIMLTLVASLVLTGATIRRIAAPSDPGRAELVLAVTSWIEEHVPQGETVGFGGSLANNVAVELIRRNPAAQVREQQGIVFSARSPFAVRVPGTSSVHDWIALFDAPRNPRTFYGYSLTSFERQLRSSSVNTLVLMGTEDDPGIVIAKQLFTPDHGVQVLASWDLPVDDPAVAGLVLGVQPDRLRFGSDVLMTEEALRRLVVQLQDAGVAGREAAAEVLDRAVVVDPGPQSISLEATLRRLAAGG